MPAIVVAQANKLIDASNGTAALTAFSGAAKIRLTTTAPSGTAAGTELTGTGYTAGGATITFAAAASGSAANSAQVLWTNSSGSAWSIVGVEIWDSAGTPIRWWYGTFNGQPISIANGNSFAVAASGLSLSLA